jgi:nitrogen regulatory protein P-II 2
MKFIMAIVKPARLDPVREALTAMGVSGMTVTEVRGFGRQGGHKEIYRGAEYEISFVPKIRIDVAVPADIADRVVETILSTARTESIGDGKVFVFDLAEAHRIRTGETGAAAL